MYLMHLGFAYIACISRRGWYLQKSHFRLFFDLVLFEFELYLLLASFFSHEQPV